MYNMCFVLVVRKRGEVGSTDRQHFKMRFLTYLASGKMVEIFSQTKPEHLSLYNTRVPYFVLKFEREKMSDTSGF